MPPELTRPDTLSPAARATARPRPDFSTRSTEPEWMDSEAVSLEDFRACLADLAQVNIVTRTHAPTLAWLAQATRGRRRFSLLDVGFGQGDLLRLVARWAARRGLEAELAGIDLNPQAAAVATALTPAGLTPPDLPIRYLTGDALAHRPDQPYDLIVSTQFAHHLDDAALVALLRWQEATARRGWFISDLHRHPVAYYGFIALSRLAGWHRFVRHDGPISVARSFTRADWRRLLAAAGIERQAVRMRWHMPFRLCVGRLR